MVTSRRWQAICKQYLAPTLRQSTEAGLSFTKGLLVVAPVDLVLRCFNVETTSWGASAVYALVQPLYVPGRGLIGAYSVGLGGRGDESRGTKWHLDEGALDTPFAQMCQLMRDEGLDFLERIGTLPGFAGLIEQRLAENPRNSRLWEDLAYTRLLAGDVDAGADAVVKGMVNAAALRDPPHPGSRSSPSGWPRSAALTSDDEGSPPAGGLRHVTDEFRPARSSEWSRPTWGR